MFAVLDAHSSSADALAVSWAPPQHIQIPSSSHAATPQQPLLSVWDALAAPTVFMQQALVFKEAISTTDLAAAVQFVLQHYPALGYRLSKDKDGRLCLSPPPPPAAGGITLLQGSSQATLQQLLQHNSNASSSTISIQPEHQQQPQQQQLVKLPELPDAVFGQLPGALLPDYLDNPGLSLVHVALVQLADGGCVFGLRLIHLMGDWSSARLLLRSIAAAYSGIQRPHLQGAEHNTAGAAAGQDLSTAAAAAPAECPAPGSGSSSGSSSSSSSSSIKASLPQLTPAAPLLNKLVAAARQQLPADFEPVRLKLQQPADADLFEKLAQLSSSSSSSGSDGCGEDTGGSSSNGQPQRLTYHVLPERIQELKREAQADIAAAAAAASSASASNDSSSSSRACTSHNVLLARLLQVFCALPGREGLPHDVAVSADMRAKLLLLLQQQYLSEQQQQQLGAAFGNFFASAILEDAVPGSSSLGELAVQLRAAVDRGSQLWLPDLSWASGVMGISHAALTGDECNHHHQQQQQQQAEDVLGAVPPSSSAGATAAAAAAAAGTGSCEGEQQQQQQQQQQVTWRRLHAMGPRFLLQQQMQLGLLASLSTTQWPLDYAADACFAGQLPLLAVPSFSQPQPYPLLVMQQAPPGMGGGLLLHVWLDAAEVPLLQQAVAARGGL